MDALVAKGVVLSGDEKMEDLKALMVEHAIITLEAPKSDATSAAVYSKTGGHIRTYDLDTHGENFHELAKEFVAQDKNEGATIQLH